MGERIIYSMLCTLAGTTPAQLGHIIEMACLWSAHLRGPGRFEGRLVVLTNVPDLRVPGAEPIVAPVRAADRRELFLERVRRFSHVPVGSSDQVMQMDLDALAIAPVEPFFQAIQPRTLMAAPSGLSPLDPQQAGTLMTRRERWLYRVCGWRRRTGVSACMTACNGRDWQGLMRRWAAAIRARGRGRPVPVLGDQSFLNFLFLTGAAPVRRWPTHLIHHVRGPGAPLNDPAAARAAVLHFPLAQRLEEMRRWRRE